MVLRVGCKCDRWQSLTFWACMGISVTCGPSAECQCLWVCLEMHCCFCINVLSCHLAGDFLEHIPVSVAKSLGMLIISPSSSAGQEQQCQCTSSLMSQCSSSSAGLSGRIKTWEQQKRLFHSSGKGRRCGGSNKPTCISTARDGGKC